MAAYDIRVPEAETAPTRSAGVALAVATVALVVALANHPGTASTRIGDVLRDMVASRTLDNLVHGTAVAVMVAFTFGFATLARRIGLQRPAVLLGLVSYAFGGVLTCVAVLTDGFATPDFAQHLLSHGPDTISQGLPSLLLMSALIQIATKAGFTLMSAGIFAISWPLIASRGLARATGVTGLICSVVPVGLMLWANPWLGSETVVFLAVGLALWNAMAAAMLIWGSGERA